MCIIIDTCTLSDVFDSNSINHAEFAPVLKWVSQGKGKLVYGGTKYKHELSKTKYARTFLEFKKGGRVAEVDDAKVDQQQSLLEKKKEIKRYNDPHLVAIVIVSKCRVVCTHDKGAMRLLRERAVYPRNVRRPSIYCRRSHQNLLCDENIVDGCGGQ